MTDCKKSAVAVRKKKPKDPEDLTSDQIIKLSNIKHVKIASDDVVSDEIFERKKQLGTGTFGAVYMVRKRGGKDDGKLYALKDQTIPGIITTIKKIRHTKYERWNLELMVDRPFLANLKYAFKTRDKLCLVQEFCQGGDFFTQLHQQPTGFYSESAAKFYISEIILAIEQLHKLNIVYRDIKLENIMLDASGHIVVVDFGLTKKLNKQRTKSFCGTVEYMAPEVIEQKKYGVSVDCWSIGVMLVEFLCGAAPFSNEDENVEKSKKQIMEGDPLIPEFIGEDARDLALKLLVKDPTKRLGYENGAADLKKHKFFEGINWDKMLLKLYRPPIQLKLSGDEDTTMFSEEFTKKDLSGEITENAVKDADKLFNGFNFVANILRAQPIVNSKSIRPIFKDVISRKSVSDFFKLYDIKDDETWFVRGRYTLMTRCSIFGTQYPVKIFNNFVKYPKEIEQEVKLSSKTQFESINDGKYLYIVYAMPTTGKESEIFPWLLSDFKDYGEKENFNGLTPKGTAGKAAEFKKLIGRIDWEEEFKALAEKHAREDDASESETEEVDPKQMKRSGQNSFAQFENPLLLCRQRCRTRREEVSYKDVPVYKRAKLTAPVTKKRKLSNAILKSTVSAATNHREIRNCRIQKQVSTISLTQSKKITKKRSQNIGKKEIHSEVGSFELESRPASAIAGPKVDWRENKENRQKAISKKMK